MTEVKTKTASVQTLRWQLQMPAALSSASSASISSSNWESAPLSTITTIVASARASSSSPPPPVAFTNKDVAVTLTLAEKRSISPDTRIFRFRLPSEAHISGLAAGQHVLMASNVKVYAPNVHPQFPKGGIFTPHLDALRINDTIDFFGPAGPIVYRGDGYFTIGEWLTEKKRIERFTSLGLVAGGSGIAPIWRVLSAALANDDDQTKIWLLFANRTPRDVLFKEELDALAAAHPNRFNCWYTVNAPDKEWRYSTGYVNKEMLAAHMPTAGDDAGVLMCGPAPFQTDATTFLRELGFSDDQIVVF